MSRRKYTTQPTPPPIDPSEKWRARYAEFMKDFGDFSAELDRRKYNKRWITLIGMGIFGYATYGFFRNIVTREVVTITTKTIDDDSFKTRSVASAKEYIQQIVASPEVQQSVTTALEQSVLALVNQKNIQDELSKLLATAIESNEIKKSTRESVSFILEDLVNSDVHKPLRVSLSNYLATEIQTQLNSKKNQEHGWNFIKNSFTAFMPNIYFWRKA